MALRCLRERRRRHARVVDQDVQRQAGGEEFRRARAHRREVGQIQREGVEFPGAGGQARAQRVRRSFRRRERAARQEDVRAAAREDARCLGADARVGAGYDGDLAREGRAAEHIFSRRAGPESGRFCH